MKVPPNKLPRVRGSDCNKNLFGNPGGQTPPRTWVRQFTVSMTVAFKTNSPAYVGQTPPGLSKVYPQNKLPRVRGSDSPA